LVEAAALAAAQEVEEQAAALEEAEEPAAETLKLPPEAPS